jgi:ABC-type spermidine/putrescine transport system permease subunit I
MMETNPLIGGGKRSISDILSTKIARRQWLYILPVLFFLLLFFVIPISRALYLSFWDTTFSLKHYIRFFSAPVYMQVLLNSFKIALMVTFFSLIIGYPFAYLLASISDQMANRLLVLVILSFFISLLVRNYAWMILLGRNGIINTILLNIGLISRPMKLIFNNIGVNIGMVHIMVPYMILSLYPTMKGIDRDLLKAAHILGAKRLQSFIRVFLPLSLPGVGGGCLMIFIMSLGYFITPALLGGSKDTMIAQLIEMNVTVLFNWGLAFAAAFILLSFTILVLLVYNRFLGLDRMWGGLRD